MNTRSRFHAAAAGVALALGAAMPVQAGVIQLGFVLDRSGSIGQTDWNTIVNGLSTAVGLIPVGGSDTYEVSVVTFSGTATININSVVVADPAARTALATQIGGLTTAYNGGTTNYSDALAKMNTALTDAVGTTGFTTAGAAAASYVNFATDGEPNPSSANGIAERTTLLANGIDNISIEGIGITASAANFLKDSICYPGPCDDASPYNNFPTEGFYVGVANAQGYADAIGNKIRVVTLQVPEPGTMLLLGASLLGFGFARRRKV
jgi:hypothetical protein